MRGIATFALMGLVCAIAGLSGGCQSGRGAVVSCDKCTTPDAREAYRVPSYDRQREVGYLTVQGKSCECGLEAGPAVGSACPHCAGVVTGTDAR